MIKRRIAPKVNPVKSVDNSENLNEISQQTTSDISNKEEKPIVKKVIPRTRTRVAKVVTPPVVNAVEVLDETPSADEKIMPIMKNSEKEKEKKAKEKDKAKKKEKAKKEKAKKKEKEKKKKAKEKAKAKKKSKSKKKK